MLHEPSYAFPPRNVITGPLQVLVSYATMTHLANSPCVPRSSMDRLPDQLQRHLRLVFVGTAAGQRSADLGHYYAHPGNRFWRTIHEIDLTPRRYRPHEFPALLALGIGFTDMCKVGAGMDHEALKAGVDVQAFVEKMRRYRPRTIAFTSKKAASLFYGRPTGKIALGRQPPLTDFPVVFVLASPSGAASGAWSLRPWQELADCVRSESA
jgi:TDG/mug DNA glycosylase family protein